MLRNVAVVVIGAGVLAGCGHSAYAVRTIPRIAAENVGMPVHLLEEAFGAPRKVDRSSTKLVYIWFMEQVPAGAPMGFHGCEMEATVDIRSQHVLGFALANVGWGKCREVERKIRVARG